ncbi:hypothetical protein V6Z11_D10G125500 [Gossypium hirsutum]
MLPPLLLSAGVSYPGRTTAVLSPSTATPRNRRPEGCQIWLFKPFLTAFEGQDLCATCAGESHAATFAAARVRLLLGCAANCLGFLFWWFG